MKTMLEIRKTNLAHIIEDGEVQDGEDLEAEEMVEEGMVHLEVLGTGGQDNINHVV